MPKFVSMEQNRGLTPANVNTFFVMPETPAMAQQNAPMQKTLNSKLMSNAVSDMVTDTTGTTRNGLIYMAQYGDTHTLHPHFVADWRDATPSVSTFKENLSQDKSIINNIMGVTDYGFTSFRFPYTYSSTNAMLAVINSGFLIHAIFFKQLQK